MLPTVSIFLVSLCSQVHQHHQHFTAVQIGLPWLVKLAALVHVFALVVLVSLENSVSTVAALLSVEGFEGSVEVVDQSAGVSGFHDNVIDVSFDQVIPYLAVKTLLDGTLICGSGIF